MNLPDPLNVLVRNPCSPYPKEASGKHECIPIQYQIALERQPTYSQEQPKQDRSESERKAKGIGPATAHKRRHSYPCNSSADGQDEQPQFGVVSISPWEVHCFLSHKSLKSFTVPRTRDSGLVG